MLTGKPTSTSIACFKASLRTALHFSPISDPGGIYLLLVSGMSSWRSASYFIDHSYMFRAKEVPQNKNYTWNSQAPVFSGVVSPGCSMPSACFLSHKYLATRYLLSCLQDVYALAEDNKSLEHDEPVVLWGAIPSSFHYCGTYERHLAVELRLLTAQIVFNSRKLH